MTRAELVVKTLFDRVADHEGTFDHRLLGRSLALGRVDLAQAAQFLLEELAEAVQGDVDEQALLESLGVDVDPDPA